MPERFSFWALDLRALRRRLAWPTALRTIAPRCRRFGGRCRRSCARRPL